ncbi:hypothetical protein ACOSQ4_029146 [Xanthoceras sorbifolium]
MSRNGGIKCPMDRKSYQTANELRSEAGGSKGPAGRGDSWVGVRTAGRQPRKQDWDKTRSCVAKSEGRQLGRRRNCWKSTKETGSVMVLVKYSSKNFRSKNGVLILDGAVSEKREEVDDGDGSGFPTVAVEDDGDDLGFPVVAAEALGFRWY